MTWQKSTRHDGDQIRLQKRSFNYTFKLSFNYSFKLSYTSLSLQFCGHYVQPNFLQDSLWPPIHDIFMSQGMCMTNDLSWMLRHGSTLWRLWFINHLQYWFCIYLWAIHESNVLPNIFRCQESFFKGVGLFMTNHFDGNYQLILYFETAF